MRANIIKIFLVLMVGISFVSYANDVIMPDDDSFQFVVFEKGMPICVDGDLSDWNQVTSVVVPVDIDNSISGFIKPNSEEDLSGRFLAFADSNLFYLAVKVTDDKLVFDESYPGRAYWDDAIAMHFMSNRRFEIIVTADSSGTARADCLINHLFYPYMAELFEIKAALQKSESGYVVEVSAPLCLLELTDFDNNKGMSMAVRIWDDDDGGFQESGLDWRQSQIDNTKPFVEEELYNRIRFVKEVLPGGDEKDYRQGDSPRQVLTIDNLLAYYKPLINVFESYLNGDIVTAENELNKVGVDIRTDALLATMKYRLDPVNGIGLLIKTESNFTDERFIKWLSYGFYHDALEIAEHYSIHGFPPENAEALYLPLSQSNDIETRKKALYGLVKICQGRDMLNEALNYAYDILKLYPDDYYGKTMKYQLERQLRSK